MKTGSLSFGNEIFEPGFPLDGPHLVAASAGTGKTHNIQNICARLVMERGLRISEIQVMTFTEAATKELSDRVRAVFANASRFLSGDKDGMAPHEVERQERLRNCARATLGGPPDEADHKARTAVELALLEYDQAAISTIHGFCRRALRRFAFETDSAFRAELQDVGGAELARRASDWWRVHRPGFPLEELCAAVQALGGKTDWTIETDGSGAVPPVLETAKAIVDQYEKDRPVRDVQTFDDLLRALRGALDDPVRGPALARKLRGEFKAVVVDEFQDTDPVQYAIFRKAFIDVEPPDGRPPLFFVGDPKQAIYSFRGGDIFTYRAAAKSPAVAGHTYWLDQNFRSTPRLVDAVNLLFLDHETPDGALSRTFGDETIPYGEKIRASDVKGLPVPGAKEDPHPFRIVRVGDADARNEAVVAAVLATLAEQRGLDTVITTKQGVEEAFGPKHIAILVTSNDAGRNFQAALRDRGVPAVLQRSGNVFAGETAADFRLVLMAMAGLGGRGQIRAALATSFFDFSPEDLAQEDGDAFAEMVGVFGELNRIWATHGFNAAFAALEKHSAFRVHFAALPAGERRLADLFQMVDLANAAVRERGPAPDVLVDWITERINLSSDKAAEAEVEEYYRELESDADAVKIMTVHSSKGLEFPVTIVPLPASSRHDGGGVWFHHDEEGRLFVGPDERGAAVEAEDEKMRLLYVAFTRASMRCVVVAADRSIPAFERLVENAGFQGAGPDNPPDSPIFWSDRSDGDSPPEEHRPDADSSSGPLSEAKTPRRYSQPRLRGSYSSLSPTWDGAAVDAADRGGNVFGGDSLAGDTGKDVDGLAADGSLFRPDAGEDEANEHPIFSIGGGAKTGTCWHDILERIPFDAPEAAIRGEALRSMRLHGLAKGDATETDDTVAAVADMIGKTLDRELVSPSGETFSLRAVKPDERFSEWEFDFSSAEAAASTVSIAAILKDEWKGDASKALFLQAVEHWDRVIPKGFLLGFLDLLFRHDGYYYVVDWKSNKLGGRAENFSAEGVAEEMAKEGYFFQYLLYAAVLHRFLKETMGADYSWERNFGGIRYYFLRGIAAGAAAAVFEDRPSERLLDRLCDALGLKDRPT